MRKYPENRIKEIRESLGLSRQILADRLGTHERQIYKLENGERELTHSWMLRLSEAMNRPVQDFIASPTTPSASISNDAQAALMYAVKALIGVITFKKPAYKNWLKDDFERALTYYQSENLPDAISLTKGFLELLSDPQQQEARETTRKILSLSPVKRA